MNYYLNVQAELIRKWDNLPKLTWGQYDNFIFFTTDGYVGHFIPKKQLLIDIEMFKKVNPRPLDCNRLIGHDDEYVNACITGTIIYENTELITVEFNGQKVYFNAKQFKEFRAKEFAIKLKTKPPKNIAMIYYKDMPYGLISPVHPIKGNNDDK